MNISEKFEICTRGLREYAVTAGFSSVIIGLSGGIDSSVVAVMCAHTFGAAHVHGVLLPGPYSSDHSISDAQQLAQNLHIETQTISICKPYSAFCDVLGGACGGTLSGAAAENTQARCRMVVLMALSNAHGHMLVNTGNKSEAAMGYSTLYGDTAGAYAPIGCLYKTDVYAMARYMNSEEFVCNVFSGGEVCTEDAEVANAEGTHMYDENPAACPLIPENVLLKAPSAELSAGQEDEKALGMPYELLDKILIAHFEHGLSSQKIADQLRDSLGDPLRQIEDVINKAHTFAFKRAMEPPFPQEKMY